MAWVLISDQAEVTATLTASGNPYDPSNTVGFRDGVVFPDGGHARGESWTLSFDKPCRIGIELTWDPAMIPEGVTVSGGFSAGEIGAGYFEEGGNSLLDAAEWAMLDSGAEVTQLDYAPAFNPPDASWFANQYNCLIYVWQGGGGGGGSSYNCECDDGQPTVTLQQMRNRLARRLGFSVQVSMGALPPGMPELLDDFTRSAHEFLYRRYSVMRLRRMFTWNMAKGVRFYDTDGNVDDCPRKLDPDKLEWVGISQGDSSWQPLICGINPVLYGSGGYGIPSHYEIRQCIEVWPAPADDSWKLRIKGDFGPSPLDVDTDVLTVDPEAVFLQALANAKAHYGQPDAGNYASQATAYIRSKVAGSHQTRRYIPGGGVAAPAVRPVLKED